MERAARFSSTRRRSRTDEIEIALGISCCRCRRRCRVLQRRLYNKTMAFARCQEALDLSRLVACRPRRRVGRDDVYIVNSDCTKRVNRNVKRFTVRNRTRLTRVSSTPARASGKCIPRGMRDVLRWYDEVNAADAVVWMIWYDVCRVRSTVRWLVSTYGRRTRNNHARELYGLIRLYTWCVVRRQEKT